MDYVEQENTATIESLKSKLKSYFKGISCSPQVMDKLQDAFELMGRYESQSHLRKNSTINSLRVASILSHDINAGPSCILSSLLRELYMSRSISQTEIKELFGNKVSRILSKVSSFINKSMRATHEKDENLRFIFFELVNDIRIAFIKIADKIDMLRQLTKAEASKYNNDILQTKYIYIPILNRLGMSKVKLEIEDLCLKFLNPKIYYSIATKIKYKRAERKQQLDRFTRPIIDMLESNNINFHVIKRIKSISSIWNKVKRRGVPFEKIYDSLALRIILEVDLDHEQEKELCWKVFRLIEDIYGLKEDRTRDWLSNPKENNYTALHLTAKDKHGFWGEIQVRTRKMNDIAENGPAAHWRYKGTDVIPDLPGIDEWMRFLKKKIEKNELHEVENIDETLLTLYDNEVCVFYKSGCLKKVPIGTTALDVAFMIDEERAPYMVAAEINRKICPINNKLSNGDYLRIICSNSLQANEGWLNILHLNEAKEKLKYKLGSVI